MRPCKKHNIGGLSGLRSESVVGVGAYGLVGGGRGVFPCRTDNAVGGLEPRQLDGGEASLVPGKHEGNAALAEPGQFDGKAA